jgi:hypothetical protein
VKYDVLCSDSDVIDFVEVFMRLSGFLFWFCVFFGGYLENNHLVFGVFPQYGCNLSLRYVQSHVCLNVSICN